MTVTSDPSADDARDLGRRSADVRLERAFQLIAAPEASTLSLDIFDTMLWRRVPDPVDAFPLLGARLAGRGQLSAAATPAVFARFREAAEAQARAKRNVGGGGLEIELADIYAELPAHILEGALPAELARDEIEIERELLMPDLDVMELVRFARERGKQVVAVSDTYLDEATLRELFEPFFHGDGAVDRVFPSSRYGVGKGSGLWDIVLRELEQKPHQLVHLGDNEAADIVPTKRLGIPAVYFERRPRALERILEREQHYLGDEQARPHGDAGTTALRAKVLHRHELSVLEEELKPFWRFGAVSLGPALSAFADWVVQRAQAAGASKVLCMMREGDLLSELVRDAADAHGVELVAEPAWISRHVCARASIIDGTEEELRSLLVRRRPPTVQQLCDTVGVDPALSPALRERADARLNDPAVIDLVLGELASNPELRSTMVEASAKVRERVLEYARRLLPEGEPNCVLVDLGWGGTIQMLFQRLLDRDADARGAPPVHTIGLYLLTSEMAVPRTLAGLELHGYLGSYGLPARTSGAVMRSPEILEQVCMPDVGSQVDLTADLEPVLSDAVDERLPQAAHRVAVQNGIRAFHREWNRYGAAAPGARPSIAAGDVRELLLAQVARAVVAPTEEEATAFGQWIHDENYGSAGSESIVGAPPVARAFRYMDPSKLVDLPMSEIYWPFGLAALQDEHLAEAAEAVALGQLPPAAFYSTLEAGNFEVFFDNGFGFGPERRVTVEGRRNRFGVSYARAKGRDEEIRAVRIDPVEAPCLLRVDWISLTCFVRGEADPRTVVLDTPEALSRITVRGATVEGPRLFSVNSNDPQFEIDLREEVDATVYDVIVECGYAVLLTDPRTEARLTQDPKAATKQLTRRIEHRTGLPLGRMLGGAMRTARRVRGRLR